MSVDIRYNLRALCYDANAFNSFIPGLFVGVGLCMSFTKLQQTSAFTLVRKMYIEKNAIKCSFQMDYIPKAEWA